MRGPLDFQLGFVTAGRKCSAYTFHGETASNEIEAHPSDQLARWILWMDGRMDATMIGASLYDISTEVKKPLVQVFSTNSEVSLILKLTGMIRKRTTLNKGEDSTESGLISELQQQSSVL